MRAAEKKSPAPGNGGKEEKEKGESQADLQYIKYGRRSWHADSIMKEIFEQYGGIIITVIAILAFVAIILLVLSANGGPVATQFQNMINTFFTNAMNQSGLTSGGGSLPTSP